MNFFKKTKGAVSIFLVIILVPMMTVSSLFVDASKVKLARAMADSAGDLTLNTALTDYDTKLKELYGLLATAQDTDDLFSKLEDYYRTCITSSGVSDEDAQTYVEQIMSQLGILKDDETSDIMNMQLTDFSAEKYSDANLANATVFKKQVVDFMKYRTPINTGLSFVSSLKSFSTLSKQTELVEKKQAYYEAQQTVMESLQSAWKEIASYNSNAVVTNPQYITQAKQNLDGISESYKDYGKRTIMSLYQKYNPIVANKFNITVAQTKEKNINISSGKTNEDVEVWMINYGGTPYYSYLSDYYSNQYSLSTKKLPTQDELKTAITGFYNAYKNVENKNAPNYESTYYSIQFMSQKKSEIESYVSASLNLFLSYQKLKNILLWLDGYDLTDIKDDDGNKITTDTILSSDLKIGNQTKKISQWLSELNIDSTFDSCMYDFSSNADIYNRVANSAYDEYDAQWNIDDSTGISTAVTNIHDMADGYVTTISDAITNLTNAIAYLNDAKTQLTTNVESAKGAWNKVATDKTISSTSLAKQDTAEIAQLDTYLNETNIQKLITRLENIKTDLESNLNQIKSYTFADKFIGEIEGYDGLETVCGGKWNNLNSLDIDKSKVTNDATSRAAGAWHSGNINTTISNQSGHQLDLTKDQTAMYTYMYTHFAGSTQQTTAEEKTENGKDLYKSIKSTAENESNSQSSNVDSGTASTEANTAGNEISGQASLPSKNTSGETPSGSKDVSIDNEENSDGSDKTTGITKKSTGVLSSLFGEKFLNAITDMATGLRDNLYFSDYVMSMFSYDTIENEYNVKNKKEIGTTVPEGALLSLTKNDISVAKNYAYGSEVEYIIYGGTNSSNLTKAYGTIYGIRFGFNLIYAFATSEIRDSAFAIATPISAATLGVIPVPLIQAVIIIGMACCESAIDLSEIRNGESVQLYKSSSTWHCSISGLINTAINTAKGIAGKEIKKAVNGVVDSGVEKLNEMLDMTDEELNDIINDSTNSVVSAVESAYDQIITENANLAIQQLTTLVNTAVQSTMCLDVGETYEQKKSDMKQWIKTKLNEWKSEQVGDDFATTVKREAIDAIISNSNTAIDGLFDKVEASVKSTDAGDTVLSILEDSEPVEKGIDQLGGQIMEYIEIVRGEITGSISSVAGKVQKAKEDMLDEVRESISGGADELKEKLNEQLDGIFGSNGSSADATSTASLFSFSYSDYLRLFVLIGMYTNQEGIILRTADVIQVNMSNQILKDKNYELKNAATYVKITATIQVKPTLLALPLFANVSKNPYDNSNWYTIEYSGIAGY